MTEAEYSRTERVWLNGWGMPAARLRITGDNRKGSAFGLRGRGTGGPSSTST